MKNGHCICGSDKVCYEKENNNYTAKCYICNREVTGKDGIDLYCNLAGIDRSSLEDK